MYQAIAARAGDYMMPDLMRIGGVSGSDRRLGSWACIVLLGASRPIIVGAAAVLAVCVWAYSKRDQVRKALPGRTS